MSDSSQQEPGEEQPRERSDLHILFLALAYGVLLIVAPTAARWVFRAGVAIYAVAVFLHIRSIRRLPRSTPHESGPLDIINNIVAAGIAVFWIWYVGRGYAAGYWIDATLAAVVSSEIMYLFWLNHRGHR